MMVLLKQGTPIPMNGFPPDIMQHLYSTRPIDMQHTTMIRHGHDAFPFPFFSGDDQYGSISHDIIEIAARTLFENGEDVGLTAGLYHGYEIIVSVPEDMMGEAEENFDIFKKEIDLYFNKNSDRYHRYESISLEPIDAYSRPRY